MNLRARVKGDLVLGLLLIIDGVMNLVLPFTGFYYIFPLLVTGLEFLFTPPDWRYRNWLGGFTILAVAGASLIGVAVLYRGFLEAAPFVMVGGVVLLALNLVLFGYLLYMFRNWIKEHVEF